MATSSSTPPVAAVNPISSAVNPISSAVNILESRKTLIDGCLSLLRSLSDSLSALDASIAARSSAIDSRLLSLDSSTAQTLTSLADRDASLYAAAAALLDSRKAAALVEIESAGEGGARDVKDGLIRRCRWMDSKGLWRFMVGRRKDLGILKKEIPGAVAEAVDPERLVLDTVEDFLAHGEEAADRFWACGLLLKALLDKEGGRDGVVARCIAARAAEIAEEWKGRMEGKGENVGGSEGQMFLQFAVAFGVWSRVELAFLRRLVVEFVSWKEVPKLAGAIGFGEMMGDMISEVIGKGKQLEAVYLAHETGMTDKFAPATLLKTYLENSKKKAKDTAESGKNSEAVKEESRSLELGALRSIVKCVQLLKLEPQFSLNSIKTRIGDLEKIKFGKKKSYSSGEPMGKRAYMNGGSPAFRPPKAARTAYSSSYQTFSIPSPSSYASARAAAYGYGDTPAQDQTFDIPQHYNKPEDTSLSGRPRFGSSYVGLSYSGGYDSVSQPPSSQQPSFTWHRDR